MKELTYLVAANNPAVRARSNTQLYNNCYTETHICTTLDTKLCHIKVSSDIWARRYVDRFQASLFSPLYSKPFKDIKNQNGPNFSCLLFSTCLFVLLVSLSSLFSCYQQSQCAGMAAISDGSSEAQDKLQEKIYKSLQPLYANIVSELYRNFFFTHWILGREGV